jgi:hypothetical protein
VCRIGEIMLYAGTVGWAWLEYMKEASAAIMTASSNHNHINQNLKKKVFNQTFTISNPL